MTILVTGSSGFIGRHAVKALRNAGHTFIGADRSGTEGWDFAIDIRDSEQVRWLFEKIQPSAVIHLAARVGVRESVLDPSGYAETNVLGSLNVLEACRLSGVQQIVMASTSSVYGNTAHQVETAAPQPLSPYAASKVGMEALAHSYHALYGMNIAVLRLFSVYGEGIRPDLMIARLMDSILTGAPVTWFQRSGLARDWTYVGDVVRGILAALDVQGYEIINIGRGEPVRLSEIIQLIKEISGRQAWLVNVETPATEPLATCADIRKAQRMLGYAPQVGIEEGLRRTWAWVQEAMRERLSLS